MKIFAAGIATETNTFSPLPTGFADFSIVRASGLGLDDQAFALFADWRECAEQRGAEFVFSLMAFAQPAGLTTRAAYERIRDAILSDLEAALPVDIVLLNLHGAMVADGYDDCEQDLIRHVRERVGPEAVIAVELDLHCNLSEATLDDVDIAITYKEYPHTDINARAAEVFDLAFAAGQGQIVPRKALCDLRMVGIYGTSSAPMREIVRLMMAMEKRKGVLSVSFAHGFPWGDVPHCGAKVLVIADTDERLAQKTARELAAEIYGQREVIGLQSLPMEAALARAASRAAGTVVVADQSDNAGGGAPADATFALRWLLDHHIDNAATAIFYDPQVVQIAKSAGVGARLAMRLGGKIGRASGDPLDIVAEVTSLLENHHHALPQESGRDMAFPLGDVAALHCNGIDIVVSSIRSQCFSPSIFSDVGVDPRSKRILIPKSTQHFYSGFAPIAAEVIYMAAPGAVMPDICGIPYQRLDTRYMYPWIRDPSPHLRS